MTAAPRIIVLPIELDRRLKRLSLLTEETAGVLLYRTQATAADTQFIADAIYMLGRGKPHTVQNDPQRGRVVRAFLDSNHVYRALHWHTHPSGNSYPSNADAEFYRYMMDEDPAFLALIIAPHKRSLIQRKGAGPAGIRTLPPSAEFYVRETHIHQQLRQIGRRLGLEAKLDAVYRT